MCVARGTTYECGCYGMGFDVDWDPDGQTVWVEEDED